jgi:hypothetical protein
MKDGSGASAFAEELVDRCTTAAYWRHKDVNWLYDKTSDGTSDKLYDVKQLVCFWYKR